MTISSTTNRNNYTGNGATNNYSYTFRIFSDTDLLVTVRNTSNVETTLSLTTDYTVSGAGSANGSITLVDASQAWLTSGFLTTGYVISIRRVRPLTQGTDIRNQGDFYPEVHEDAFDHFIMLEQQQQDELNRSVKLSETTDPADFDATLPSSLVGEASVAIVTNATGDGLAVGPTTSEISNAQTYATNASTSASQASASATLASEWASKIDGQVASTDYSSKAWSIGGTGVTDTASAGASKEWATKTSGTVDTSEYSAKYYAQQASSSATQAQNAVASVIWNDVVFLTSADSPYTVTNSQRGKLLAVDCTSGNVTITLPEIATLDLTSAFVLGIKKTDSTGNSITVNRSATDTIDGNTSKTISVANSGATLIPDTDPSPDTWTSSDFGSSAGNLTVDQFSGDGTTTGFTLSTSPASENNTFIYISGVYQEKDTYSVSGTTLTFSEAPPTGTNNIEVVSGTLLSIGTPSDGTVTKAKLTQGATANLAVTSKTANYTVLTTDQVNLGDASGGAFTYTLPTAVGNEGLTLYFKKTDSTFNVITIDGSASETIDGNTTRNLCTQNESIKITSDGSNWHILERNIPSEWVDNGAINFGATTTAPTKGSSITVDRMWYKREGDSLSIRLEYLHTSAGSSGTGDYLIPVPSGLTIDPTKSLAYTTILGAGNAIIAGGVGSGVLTNSGTDMAVGAITVYDSSNVRLHVISCDDGIANSLGTFSSAYYNFTGTTLAVTANYVLPITNWEG